MFSTDSMLQKVLVLLCVVAFTSVSGVRRRRQYSHVSVNTTCIHDLCTNVTNYPAMYIQNLIDFKSEFHPYFGSVIQPYTKPTLAPRYGKNVDDGKNMCETLRFTYFPEVALNKNKKRMWIVNVDKFKQAVTFETCLPKGECIFSAFKPIGYETFCKQQYNLIRLVSMTEDGTFHLDSFPIPSSCVCSYRSVKIKPS